MKIQTLLTIATLAFACASHSFADDKKPTAAAAKEEKKNGPTNGRLITSVTPNVEFLITADKKVEIRFVDAANKVIAPADQVVTVTLGERSAPTKLSFTKDGDKLVSDKTIPAGNDYPTVVQIKAKAGEKAVLEKFNLNLDKCPTCKFQEYNCTCEHDHDEKK